MAANDFPVIVEGGPVSPTYWYNPIAEAVTAARQQLLSVERSATVILGADTPGNSTTTLQNAAGLAVSLAAGTRYWFYGLVLYTAPAANDFSFGITSPAGSTMAHHAMGPVLGMAGDDGQTRWAVSTSASGLIVNVGGAAAVPIGLHWVGTITTSSAAGDLQVQYAAQTGGGAAVVKAGSSIHIVTVP